MRKTTIIIIFIFGAPTKEPNTKVMPESKAKCVHERIYEDPDLLGQITPTIRCRDCTKSWDYPGWVYIDQRQPAALKQQKEYEAIQQRLR